MRFHIVLLAFLAVINFAEGRRKCWFCMNAKSTEQCKMEGHVQECLVNQQYCQNEIRAIAGGRYFEITKRCKQDNSCDNNQMQNFTGTYPFQCDTELPHSVCRCCCGFDRCNEVGVGCVKEKPKCPIPESPDGGFVRCPFAVYPGDSCIYSCNLGLKLIGEKTTTCEYIEGKLVWTNPPPKCEAVPCMPIQVDPLHGKVSCTDENNVGSRCTFICDPTYALVGVSPVICSLSSVWSAEPPTCKIVTCNEPMPEDKNRIDECADGYPVDSTCSFKCKDGYELKGEEEITCIQRKRTDTKGVWNKKAPTCEPSDCPEIVTEVDMKCSDGNKYGSECTFACGPGQYMIDSNGTVILSNVKKIECGLLETWTSDAPTCEDIVCNPPMTAPENGAVSCSDDNKYKSVCDFQCDEDYDLKGSDDTECIDDGNGDEFGRWSRKKPTCDPGPCDPIITDLTITCTDGTEYGSTCTMECKAGEYMRDADGTLILRGEKEVTCGLNKLWSSGPPTCHPITCVPEMTAPVEGSVACSDENRYKSVCDFKCNKDFELVGPDDTECLDDGNGDEIGRWSRGKPVCNPEPCDKIITDLTIECTDGNEFGSTCKMQCEIGEYMLDVDGTLILLGEKEVTCGLNREWSSGPPTCHPITCVPEMTAPDFGTVSCTNENFYKSDCLFECNPRYKLKGDETTTCEADDDKDEFGEWSNDKPICEAQECDEPDTEENVETTCTKGFLIGSVCTFKCRKGQKLTGTVTTTCVGKTDGSKPEWEPEVKPKCEDITCPVFPKTGENPHREVGSLTCLTADGDLATGDSFPLDTTCRITCNKGYQAKSRLDESKCADRDDEGIWDVPQICCVICVENLSLDIVMYIDSSDADEDLWEKRTTFAVNFTDFITKQYNFELNITFIPYASDVNIGDEIGFLPIDNRGNGAERLRDDLNNLPFAGSGVSNLGEALRFANEELFNGFSDHRVPMVFVVTAREPDRPRYTVQMAEALRARKIHVRIFPITDDFVADPGENRDIFEEIAGEFEYVVEEYEEDFFYDTAADGLITVTKELCNERTQGGQRCLFVDSIIF